MAPHRNGASRSRVMYCPRQSHHVQAGVDGRKRLRRRRRQWLTLSRQSRSGAKSGPRPFRIVASGQRTSFPPVLDSGDGCIFSSQIPSEPTRSINPSPSERDFTCTPNLHHGSRQRFVVIARIPRPMTAGVRSGCCQSTAASALRLPSAKGIRQSPTNMDDKSRCAAKLAARYQFQHCRRAQSRVSAGASGHSRKNRKNRRSQAFPTCSCHNLSIAEA